MAQILVVIVMRVAGMTLRLAWKILRLVRRALSLIVWILRLAGDPETGWMALILFERVLKLARKALLWFRWEDPETSWAGIVPGW